MLQVRAQNCTMQLITYPDVVYKVPNDAILIQTRCVQSVVSLEMYICWLNIGCASLKYKIPIALYKMFKPARLVQSELETGTKSNFVPVTAWYKICTIYSSN